MAQEKETPRKVEHYQAKCNNCELPVALSCERPLTEKELGELQFRMLCNDCLKKRLAAKG